MSKSRTYERYFKPISKTPFSSSGTIRSQGRVGQTSLSRSITRTSFRGENANGHGGVSGNSIVYSCCGSTPSLGYLSVKNRPSKVNTVKDFSPENNSQSGLLEKTLRKMHQSTPIQNQAKRLQTGMYFMGRRRFNLKPYTKHVSPLSSSHYTQTQYLYTHPTEPCCDISV